MDKFKGNYRIETARAPKWDYGSSGSYYITICCSDSRSFFGKIKKREMILNLLGMIVVEEWLITPVIRKDMNLSTMNKATGNSVKFGPQSKNLSSILRGFKSSVTTWARKNKIVFDWQPRFHDHIIRSRAEFIRITNYIRSNPAYWKSDSFHKNSLQTKQTLHMGLSIHYQGSLKNFNLIEKLVAEVIEICRQLKWDYDVFDDKEINGISFGPENCDPLFMTFSKDGKLCNPIYLQFNIEPTTVISTKTQYAGMEMHKAIIKLLKYLKTKYFSNFELDDEGGYWENEDENVLMEQFNRYEFALNKLTAVLKNFKTIPGESIESTSEKLQEFLRKKLDQ